MTTKMNLNGTTRKALVTAIAEITGEQPIYCKVPTCNYDRLLFGKGSQMLQNNKVLFSSDYSIMILSVKVIIVFRKYT